MLGKLGNRHQTDIGNAKKHVGDAGAGDIGGGKALIGHDARRQRIGDAGQEQRRARAQHVAKFMARRAAGHGQSFPPRSVAMSFSSKRPFPCKTPLCQSMGSVSAFIITSGA